MLNFIFLTQPFRKWLIKMYKVLPSKLKYKLLDKLYPDDLEVTFVDECEEEIL